MQRSDVNWLLHRAAQRLGSALNQVALAHGIDIRGQIVLTALVEQPQRSQLALGAAVGLDKTTLTTALDKLEHQGLIVRRPDPNDRRARIPEVTDSGRALQGTLAIALHAAEREAVSVLSDHELDQLRSLLYRLANCPVADAPAPSGSCV